ncbi:mitotic spindle checkpoint protein BUB3, WD repeat superfamily [Metschnikowia bicuspidata var. bicuspidata NRRL YB-4993]|uniref:Mitotic spindle checkpoint protein BUB3, WD repeat superfamily n=1 Tax=Metschnikowia bicuspidata var. bicuspidata NRRL YB-4993 TaxID=869754 RepID=A0A1A0H8A9_9ASCO|nr:mitotic spindle checkpoint protein BUB3, WD repeat superfamily [Metschnikowia bicuspidata var. bicuspidata NRRL YB-4993]OBA20215.1 mitotic spindle checkpoint protein BUB3, WD repeat superfamily [Metschnikowia bicuspidata var. bicuspidata NRRL YB-4993]
MAVETSLEYRAASLTGPISSDFSEFIQSSTASTVNPSNVYELTQSESLIFLYNLLYDDDSALTKADILSILSCLKERESNLPFAFTQIDPNSNVQGVAWDLNLRRKFYQERARVANSQWFTNVPMSREEAIKFSLQSLKLTAYDTKTDFFEFHKFYSRLKNHITHFQLRSLVVCGQNAVSGIFYPSSYFHDDMLEPVFLESDSVPANDCHSFFKLIRLMQDETSLVSESMKLDCLVDSRHLKYHSASRISSMACSSKFLAAGTFEGGFILVDIEDPNDTRLSTEVLLTRSSEGITNDIDISSDNLRLTVASNDAKLRHFDVEKSRKTSSIHLPFAVNRLVSNPHNNQEFFVAADSKENFIWDRRCLSENPKPSVTFLGHKDYGFSCDWSPRDEHLLVSGNQDGTVRLWDRRMAHSSLHCWNSALGSHAFDIDESILGGPVRNCRFSHFGNHVVWAESLDHVGVIQMDDLKIGDELIQSRVQLIDFVGKCIGLNVRLTDSGHDEELIIGINDCPLGGVLSYRLDAPGKLLPLDFEF